MKNTVVLTLLLGLGVLVCGPAVAQKADKNPEEVLQSAARSYREGAWDSVIGETTPLIDSLSPTADGVRGLRSQLQLLRGLAAEQISWFGLAERDLSPFAMADPSGAGLLAANTLRRIERVKPLVPREVEEIKDGDKVLFRVYYEEMDPWVRGMIDSLPLAYETNHRLMGFELLETPVFIFSSNQNFRNFYTALIGQAPSDTLAGLAASGAILIPPPVPGSRLALGPQTPGFNSMTIHEFNHCILRRVWGRGRPPQWFVEGMASVAEAFADESEGKQLMRRFQRAGEANALILPANLRQDELFRHASELGSRTNRGSTQGPDPYAQGYHMTMYLLNSLKKEQILPFLTSLRTKSFSDSLVEFAGGTEDQFYDSWMQSLKTPQQ